MHDAKKAEAVLCSGPGCGCCTQAMEVPSRVDTEDGDAAPAYQVPSCPEHKAVTAMHVDVQNDLLWLGEGAFPGCCRPGPHPRATVPLLLPGSQRAQAWLTCNLQDLLFAIREASRDAWTLAYFKTPGQLRNSL